MAEKRVIELDIQTNNKSLKAQLREAQAEVQKLAEKFGATSDEAVRAAKKAAELKDAIGDAKALTDAYNPDAKFNALSTSISGVLNGFQAYEGALGLLGVESEELKKTLLKVQSAMALTQGINGVLESKESFKNLGKQVSSLASSATTAFKGMTNASKALAVTGIGLLITAIGLVIANWESVSKAIGLSNDEQKKYAAQQKAINEESKKQREEVSKQSSGFALLISQLKNTNANSKERIDLINKINSQYGTTLKNLKDEKKFQEQVNAELANYLEYQRQKYQLQKNEDLIARNLAKQDEIRKKLNKETQLLTLAENKYNEAMRGSGDYMGIATKNYETQKNKVDLLNQELANAQKRFDSYGAAANNAQVKVGELTNQGTKYVDKSSSNAATETKTITEIADLRQQIYEEQIKQIQDLNAQQQTKLIVDAEARIKEVQSSTATEEQKAQLIALIRANLNTELEQLDADYYAKEEEAKVEANRLKVEAENDYLNEIELLQESNYQNTLTEQEKEIQAVNDKYFALEEAAKGNAEQLAIIEEAKQNELDKIETTYAEKAKLKQQERIDLILKYAQTFAQAMSSLNTLLNANDEERLKNVKKGSKEEEAIKRKMFERDKKLRIVQTIIDTASNVVQSVRNGGGIPAGIPFGVAAAAMGAFQIAAISKAKFEGGGEQVQSASGSTGAMSPNFNVIGSSGVNQLAQIQQQPTRAYVVSGDISNGLSLERNRLQNASF
jgi:hypothetical protein